MHPSYSHSPPAIPLEPPLMRNWRRNPQSGGIFAARPHRIRHFPFVGLNFAGDPIPSNRQSRLSKSVTLSCDALLPIVNGGVSARRLG